MRVSLAQTGKWLVDRGQVYEPAPESSAVEFSSEEIARWSTTSETPMGQLRHLAPTLQLSETQSYWERPAIPLGHHEPKWPRRLR